MRLPLLALPLVLLLALPGCRAGSFDIEAPSITTVSAVEGLRRGEAYSEVRAVLENAGWQGRDFRAYPAEQRCGLRQECSLYPETESCTSTGSGQCRFAFVSNEGERLSVVTAGLEPGALRISSWAYAPQ